MPADGRAESPPQWLRLADAGLSHVEDSLNLIAALAVFFLMFVGVAQIIGRTVFDFAIYGYIDWIEQASSLFAFLGIAYAQRLGSHIGMDLTIGWRPEVRWKIELFGVVLAIAIITILIYASFTNFLRAWSIGDSTMDIRLPTWPAKLMVPLALSVLWLRLSLQICGYLRMIAHPDAQPVAVPKLITLETQVQDEIAEALGREELNREQGR
ncbi:MAG: TRAP transporter small permease subunit [Rhodocyclaceae bacterium]|jgi:C4-dicarboxylate transporter DctQ subunit|nr:TRAP transporter small permease [Reyranella sp.]MBL6651051.1 TRAP transporter small permease [Reyranella sp.]